MGELYLKYKDARNTAWKILIEHKLYTFPIDIWELCQRLNISVLAYDHLPPYIYSVNFTDNGKHLLLYSDSGNENTNRFTIAHELGHIILQHRLNENGLYNKYEEEQANIFASRLLSPMIVLAHNKLDTPTAIGEYFGLSEEASHIRWERFMLIVKRNKFLTSLLEREYYGGYCKYNDVTPIYN